MSYSMQVQVLTDKVLYMLQRLEAGAVQWRSPGDGKDGPGGPAPAQLSIADAIVAKIDQETEAEAAHLHSQVM